MYELFEITLPFSNTQEAEQVTIQDDNKSL